MSQSVATSSGYDLMYEVQSTSFDFDAIKHHLSNGADINYQDSDGYTPLIWAILMRHRYAAEFLISRGADVNLKADNGYTALELALQKKWPDIVKQLLSKGADAHPYVISFDDGRKIKYTPLAVATFYGWKDIVETIISMGADVNEKDRDGKTPLEIAASEGWINIVELLISKGADDSNLWFPVIDANVVKICVIDKCTKYSKPIFGIGMNFVPYAIETNVVIIYRDFNEANIEVYKKDKLIEVYKKGKLKVGVAYYVSDSGKHYYISEVDLSLKDKDIIKLWGL